MRLSACLLVAVAVAVLSGSRIALASSERCAPDAVATTGERIEEVLQHCGSPAAATHYPGAHGRYGYRLPEDVWTYDLGEGTFPRVLHFVGGVLDSIALVSRWP